MGKHTTGPWRYSAARESIWVENDRGVVVAQLAVHNDQANARLIAAAPDLLALSDLVTVYQIEGDDAVHINVCGVKIGAFGQSTHRAAALLRYEADRRAAIAKATGEASP